MGKSETRESRALSAPGRMWQSHSANATTQHMRRPNTTIAALSCLGMALAVIVPQAGHAVPGGEIGTLLTGRYKCEKPGDIRGVTRFRLPEEDFRVITGSNYVSGGKRGSYLLTGDEVVMTGGPLKGRKYRKISSRYLKMVNDDGTDSERRCILAFTTMP